MPPADRPLATVEHLALNKPPILTEGDVTPRILYKLSNAHREYFSVKAIEPKSRVRMILGGFLDEHIKEWINNDHDFMKELRLLFLPSDWEVVTRNELCNRKMLPTDKFYEWAMEIKSMNFLLKGTNSHLSDDQLRRHLETSMDRDLFCYCNREKIHLETKLKEWIENARLADEFLKDDRKRARELFDDFSNSARAKRPALASSSRFANTPRTAAAASDRCPALTDVERELLKKYHGCFRCRRYNVQHRGADCPNGYPSGKMYQTLTDSRDALGNPPRSASTQSSVTVSTTTTRKKPVAAVTEGNDEDQSDGDDFVASVMQSAALGDGSMSEPEVSAPLKSKHLIWEALIDSPALDFPVKLKTLIDNGSHLVLVRPDVVERLQLKSTPLREPLRVSVALGNGKKEITTLVDSVSFRATSSDGRWTSKLVQAIVAPNLCSSIVFGLPFLTHNKIVIDHDLLTAILKTSECKCDLLNPLFVKPVDVVAAITDQIKWLACKDTCAKEADKVRAAFKDVFDQIPHTSQLPTDYYARIKLKDIERKITNCSYPCPRKRGSYSAVCVELCVSLLHYPKSQQICSTTMGK
ncbi:hypothetical protein CPC08DRAFT_738882 [Agrocybe pediades]|nr:hypothetical protein CPC08DRAFT_738882 [Agrocybe pediades]